MIFCQACKSLNSIEQELCIKCGTRLMIMTMPPGSSGDLHATGSLEEHLLERISMLESMMGQMQERFNRVLDLVHRQATKSFYDHSMLDALISVLLADRLIDQNQLEDTWQNRISEYTREQDNQEFLTESRERILSDKPALKADIFEKLLTEGFDYLLNSDLRKGIRLLEKAVILASDNAALNLFLGEYFYNQEKHLIAQHYLNNVLKQDANNYEANLILGIIAAEQGESEPAKGFFQTVLSIAENNFIAHYALGRILVSEDCLDESLRHFKRALLLKPAPEMYFVVGYTYLLQGQAEPALKHLRKAVELDPEFDSALYHIGVIYLQRNLVDKAREHFRAAYEINPLAPYRSALKARPGARLPTRPVFGQPHITRRKLLTSGEARLVQLLHSDLKINYLMER